MRHGPLQLSEEAGTPSVAREAVVRSHCRHFRSSRSGILSWRALVEPVDDKTQCGRARATAAKSSQISVGVAAPPSCCGTRPSASSSASGLLATSCTTHERTTATGSPRDSGSEVEDKRKKYASMCGGDMSDGGESGVRFCATDDDEDEGSLGGGRGAVVVRVRCWTMGAQRTLLEKPAEPLIQSSLDIS